jgi:hypothetical protein
MKIQRMGKINPLFVSISAHSSRSLENLQMFHLKLLIVSGDGILYAFTHLSFPVWKPFNIHLIFTSSVSVSSYGTVSILLFLFYYYASVPWSSKRRICKVFPSVFYKLCFQTYAFFDHYFVNLFYFQLMPSIFNQCESISFIFPKYWRKNLINQDWECISFSHLLLETSLLSFI